MCCVRPPERLEDVCVLDLEDMGLRDSMSIASNDSFVSAAEVRY